MGRGCAQRLLPRAWGSPTIAILVSRHMRISRSHLYIHTYLHTYIHPSIHLYIHTYIHTYIHPYIHTSIHPYIHACMHACMHACIHKHTHTYIHKYIHAYIHTYIYIYIHYIHMYMCPCVRMVIGTVNRVRPNRHYNEDHGPGWDSLALCLADCHKARQS